LAHTAVRVWSCPLVDEAKSQPRRCGGELIHPNTHTLTFTCLSKMTSRPMGTEFAVYILVVDVRNCLCSHTQTLNEVLCAMVMCSWRGESAISLCLHVFVLMVHPYSYCPFHGTSTTPTVSACGMRGMSVFSSRLSSLTENHPFLYLLSWLFVCCFTLQIERKVVLVVITVFFFGEPERYEPISYVSVFCSTNHSFTEVTL
jgi:hypothetical protein